MTHDELLKQIKEIEYPWGMQDALCAVAELCNKWETKGSYCLPIGDLIQAIEKELS